MFHCAIVLVLIFQGLLAEDSCRYEHPTKGIINLSTIGSRYGPARFQDVAPSTGSTYMYSFNPCYSFTESVCHDVAVCQISRDRQYYFDLAVQNSSTWSLNSNGDAVLTYRYGQKTVSITMVCAAGDSDELEVLGESPANWFRFRLGSSCACWNRCERPQPASTTHRTSTATTAPVIHWNACRYSDSRYGAIDLSIVGNANGDAAFKDLATAYPSDYRWSYNPCYSFTENNCHQVAGCQIDPVRETSVAIASQSLVTWSNMNRGDVQNSPMITYSSPSPNRSLLRVLLVCNETSKAHHLNVVGQTAPNEYMMVLNSPCACWNGCVGPTPSPPVPFHWTIWMTIGVAGLLGACLMITMITCLMCSKPKRNYHVVAINEKAPILRRRGYERV